MMNRVSPVRCASCIASRLVHVQWVHVCGWIECGTPGTPGTRRAGRRRPRPCMNCSMAETWGRRPGT